MIINVSARHGAIVGQRCGNSQWAIDCGLTRLSDVEGSDAGALAGEQAGVVSLATAQVQAQQPVHRREQREERGVFTRSR